jgi:hypothetical protein
LRKITEIFNKCDLFLKSSAWVGAILFMKRVNQIEVEKTNCYYDTAVTNYTVFYPVLLPVHNILGKSVGSEAIINQLLVRKSAVYFLGSNRDMPTACRWKQASEN